MTENLVLGHSEGVNGLCGTGHNHGAFQAPLPVVKAEDTTEERRIAKWHLTYRNHQGELKFFDDTRKEVIENFLYDNSEIAEVVSLIKGHKHEFKRVTQYLIG